MTPPKCPTDADQVWFVSTISKHLRLHIVNRFFDNIHSNITSCQLPQSAKQCMTTSDAFSTKRSYGGWSIYLALWSVMPKSRFQNFENPMFAEVPNFGSFLEHIKFA